MPKAYWPIGKKDLDPHAVRACELLKIEPFPPNQTIDDSELQRWQLHWSPPIQFGDRYRDEVLGAANIGLLLEANALRLSTAEGRITSVELVDYAERRTFASARAFVVAMGGIENSRFLLWNNTISRGAVIPNPDTLGKYWMEHPIASYGQILLYSRSPEVLKFNLQPARQLELGALNAGLSMSSLTPLGGDAPIRELLMDLACNAPTLANWLRQQVQGRDLCTAGGFVYWEQEPRADNRIELHASAVDRFGIPRPVLHWRKSEYDFDSVRKTVIEFGRYLVAANLGRLKIDEWVLRGGPLPDTGSFAEQYGGHHHMGGTRMAASPSDGVVDADLRVHGRENLYVLGSSSFPSSGHANPTFTIVQLALRLADHLTTKA